MSYWPNGAIKQFTYGNGIVHTLSQNARGLPVRSRDAYGATAVHDDSYDYDFNGNVAAISDGLPGNIGDRTMGYDGLDRLTQVTSPMFGGDNRAAFGYDAVDNLLYARVGNKRQVTYHYDGSNQLTNVQNASGATIIGLGYDARGNVVNKNGRVLDFDYGNRLRGIDGFATYVYDGLGRRVRDTTSGGIKYSLYSHPGQLLYANDQRRGLETEYIYLGGSLVATREQPLGGSTYTTRYQHTDALGSPVAVTDSGRQVIERSQYAPYGTLLNRPVSDGPGYTGHVEDAATGLVYMQQRYYDPELGRFLSVDPVTANPNTGANFNRYWYGNNSPYKFTDPDGRQSCPTGTRLCMSEVVLQKKLDAINAVTHKYSFGAEKPAVDYFSRVANPLTRRSGKEIGANLEQRHDTDFRVVNFHFDKGAEGENGVTTIPYSGLFTWKGILHTHPGTRSFSGLGVYGQGGKYYGLYTGSDAQQAVTYMVNNYVSLSDGALRKLDFEKMSRDVSQNSDNDTVIYASSYDQGL